MSFTLIDDDFTVKYVGKHHAEHLRNALLRTYELTTDWTATVYSGMTSKCDYNKRTCNISISTRLPQAPTTYPVQVCHAGLRRQNSIYHEG
jgi:hypothetical protein